MMLNNFENDLLLKKHLFNHPIDLYCNFNNLKRNITINIEPGSYSLQINKENIIKFNEKINNTISAPKNIKYKNKIYKFENFINDFLNNLNKNDANAIIYSRINLKIFDQIRHVHLKTRKIRSILTKSIKSVSNIIEYKLNNNFYVGLILFFIFKNKKEWEIITIRLVEQQSFNEDLNNKICSIYKNDFDKNIIDIVKVTNIVGQCYKIIFNGKQYIYKSIVTEAAKLLTTSQ